MRRLSILVALAFVVVTCWAGDLTVSGAWIRYLPAGAPAGGFFKLQNAGKATALIGASSPDYGMVMIHKTVEQGGVSKMVEVDRIEIPAGGAVEFRPGGYHLMLMHAKHEIKAGAEVIVTLQFANGQKVAARYEIRGPLAK
jgi:copper(I)-binding protein